MDHDRGRVCQHLHAWQRGESGSVVHISQDELSEDPWVFARTTVSQKVFDELVNRCDRHLEDVASIFVGVQSSADDIFFVRPKPLSTTQEVVFDDQNGREWRVERGLTRKALVQRSLEPYEACPAPDRVALWPYEMEETRTGRKRAKVIQPDDLRASFPNAWSYFQHFRTALDDRSVSPPPGDAFYAYGRSQSLTKMDEPKTIVRVLSLPLSPQYAWDPHGLVVPGGGSGPYYLVRSIDANYPNELLIALMSHPVIDSMVIAGARTYRGGYAVHSKQFLKRAPVPDFDDEVVQRIAESVRELHRLSIQVRTETDSMRATSLQSRRVWLRAQLENEVSSALGLSDEDLEHFTA